MGTSARLSDLLKHSRYAPMVFRGNISRAYIIGLTFFAVSIHRNNMHFRNKIR